MAPHTASMYSFECGLVYPMPLISRHIPDGICPSHTSTRIVGERDILVCTTQPSKRTSSAPQKNTRQPLSGSSGFMHEVFALLPISIHKSLICSTFHSTRYTHRVWAATDWISLGAKTGCEDHQNGNEISSETIYTWWSDEWFDGLRAPARTSIRSFLHVWSYWIPGTAFLINCRAKTMYFLL